MNVKTRYIIKGLLIVALSAFLAHTVLSSYFAVGRSESMLRIEATGQKNDDSQGADVRIRTLTLNGEPVPMELLDQYGGWEIHDYSAIILDPQTPVSICGKMEDVKKLEIKFEKQRGSGIANIYVDNELIRQLDLYAEAWDVEHCILELYSVSILSHPGKFMLVFLLTAELLYVMEHLVLLLSKPKRNAVNTATAFVFLFCCFSMVYFTCTCNFQYEKIKFFSEEQSVEIWYACHMILLLQGLMVFLYLRQREDKPGLSDSVFIRIRRTMIKFLLITGWSFFVLTGVELLSNSKAFYHLTMPSIIFTVVLLNVLLLIFYAITRYLFLSGCIVSLILVVHAAANYFVLLFRDEVILPTDIFAIGTALNVASKYSFELCAELFMCIAFFLCGCGFLSVSYEKKLLSVKKRLCMMGFLFVLGAGYIVCINRQSVQKSLHISVNSWKRVQQCKEEGFLLTYFTNIGAAFPHKPETYSKEKLYQLFDTYNSDTILPEDIYPNIIVIMNESFADLEEYDSFRSSEPLQPFLYSLREKNNSLYGYVQVPVMGGGTSNTEFEFLTGVNAWAYPSGSPYDTLVTKDLYAFPRTMESLGYQTIALHPEIAHNWSRNKGYPHLGFQQFIDRAQMANKDLVRDYISDEAFYEEIKGIVEEKEEPLFLFGITMQNHGGYAYEDFEEPIQILEPEGDYPLATQYINLVRESDRAFEKFIAYCENLDEPTVVVFFGDHLPGVENELLSQIVLSRQNGTEQDRLLTYHTPYYIWANYDIDKEKCPDENRLLSVSFLQATVMDVAGLPKTGYQKFLSQISKIYPVVSRACVLKANDYAGEESNELLEDYALLQYTLLRGRERGMEEFYDYSVH